MCRPVLWVRLTGPLTHRERLQALPDAAPAAARAASGPLHLLATSSLEELIAPTFTPSPC